MIILNGNPQEWGAEESLLAVLERLGVASDARGIAVAIDGEVVPRARWPELALPDGAHVEVLTAMQGG